ncbi:hypothetical protein FRB99_004137 [Tulasnella sp. 403]|nr:hypothetical protein FRB99_004137 [Tulasnella sp. 403]
MLCQKFGFEAFTIVAAFPIRTVVYLADPRAIKEVTSSRFRFVKPIEKYALLNLFGDNVLTTEGLEWTRHRKVTAPAFTERNLSSVAQDTSAIVQELFDSWDNQHELAFENVTNLTTEVTLKVIARSGFGYTRPLKSEHAPGHTMSFYEALEATIRNIYVRIAIPPFFWGTPSERENLEVSGLAGRGWLGRRVQQTSVAFHEMRKYIGEMIDERRRLDEKRDDLLSSLVGAMDEMDVDSINFQEVIGSEYPWYPPPSSKPLTTSKDVFIFLIAGHETTTNAISFALGLLAIHQDKQEEVYGQVRQVIQPSHLPIVRIPKRSVEDTTLYVNSALRAGAKEVDAESQGVRMAIPKGMEIVINLPAVHCNPRYWKDPLGFCPERFSEPDWPRDAFLPFSAGARSCLGRRFGETEAVIVLAAILSRYKISTNPQYFTRRAGESPFETRERMLKVSDGVTLKPIRVPLVFTKR